MEKSLRRRGKFFSVSNQRPDLAIQDLQNIFPARFSDPRPDFSKTAVILEKQNHHRAHVLIYQNIYVCCYYFRINQLTFMRIL